MKRMVLLLALLASCATTPAFKNSKAAAAIFRTCLDGGGTVESCYHDSARYCRAHGSPSQCGYDEAWWERWDRVHSKPGQPGDLLPTQP